MSTSTSTFGVPPFGPNGSAAKAFRRRNVLAVQPPPDTPETFVARALAEIHKDSGGDQQVSDVNNALAAQGLVEAVGKATTKLNAGGLDRTQRLLLSVTPVYATLIEAAMTPPAPPAGTTTALTTGLPATRVNFADTAGLVDFILRELDKKSGIRESYGGKLVDAVAALRGLSLPAPVRTKVIEDVSLRELPVPSRKVDELINTLIDERRSTIDVETKLSAYKAKGEIDPLRFTPTIERRMTSFIKNLGVDMNKPSADLDEYFALAYNQAIRAGDGATVDPIDAVRQKGALTDWDFTVDTFDSIEEQGVVAQNILAAGALDYVFNLGERLGMFKLADALVLRWASGTFDAEPGAPSADLYRYWKLRSERISAEERAMMYKRILAKGDGNLLSGMVENEAFPDLWGALMSKATDFLERSEENASSDRQVSRQPIYQATKQLQYNLTEHATGMAHMQITEMYHHLLEAKKVLEHAIDYFSTGSRKSLWTVIERASREWFDEAPNISAIRSSAIDGNKVFQWIAAFDQSNVTDEQFQALLDASEAWIISAATDDSVPAVSDSDEDEDADEDIGDDSADDWDA
jgi:hypothetical protein